MGKWILVGVLSGLIAAPLNAQNVRDDEAWRAFAVQLEPNAFIKVRLTSGKSFRGYVVGADQQELRVNPKTRVAEPLRRLAYSDIVSIERQKEPKWNPAAKVLLGVGISWAVLYGVALLLLAGAYD
jgi:hypothetical protein